MRRAGEFPIRRAVKRLRILPLFLLVTTAYADPPTYGTEFNFTNLGIEQEWRARPGKGPGDAEIAGAKAMAAKVREICGDCEVVEHVGKFGATEYRVKFPDGWGFNISIDPACVEIQTFPATAAEIRDQVTRIEKYIFYTAQQAGLLASRPYGTKMRGESNAHLNIGMRSAFDQDPKGFMRFLADYANRVGLGRGIFGRSSHNAPVMSELGPDQRNAFQLLIEDVNSGKVTLVEEIIRRMNFEVYTRSPDFGDRASSGRHYQAIGLKQLIKDEFSFQDMPFELRAVRQPGTAQEYQLLTELMDARISHLKSLGGAEIRFVETTETELVAHTALPKVQALEFALYVEETGLKWKKFESLVTPEVRDVLNQGFVEKFLAGAVDWEVAFERIIFTEVLVKGAMTSAFLESKLFEFLTLPATPGVAWSIALEKLVSQAEKGGATARVAGELSEKIIDRAQASGTDLAKPAGAYRKAIRNNARPLNFFQKCVRLFSNLIP